MIPRLLGLLLAATLVASAASAEARAADKPQHALTVQGKEIGGKNANRFKLYGAVPTYLGQELLIQRKVNRQRFRPWRTDVTSADTGSFDVRIYGGKRGSKICYRVVVPATADHARTTGARWCIKTKRR